MECWQYVCDISWGKLLNPDKFFYEGQKGKIVGDGHELILLTR